MGRDLRSSIVGCLLGGALGDAWGGRYEGVESPELVDADHPLVVSDDTQLTVATCEAIVGAGGLEPERIAEAFVRWYRAGRLTGLGSSTLSALRSLAAGSHWALAGASGERAAGNGAAMRIAPVAFLVDPRSSSGRRMIRDVASVTHRNDAAYAGALAIALAIRLASEGVDLKGLPEEVATRLPDTAVRDAVVALMKLDVDFPPADAGRVVGNSGYVAESVPLAIHFARRAGDGLEASVRRAIEAGGDCDTIASMCGQIVGAAVGESGLPDRVSRVEGVDDLREVFETFAVLVEGGG
ncbi:MAG: ADP-ribosylglycohydrolase family protein [Deltaproteobacteria bacterium]